MGLKPRAAARFEAGHDVVEAVEAGELPVTVAPQGIQAEVEVAQADGQEVRGQFRQAHAVGGEADFLDPGNLVQVADELQDAPAHQGLAAGDPDLLDAHPGGHPGQAQQLFVAQDFRGRQLLPAPPGGAVETAEIAAVGDGDPQVIDLARQNIFHLIILSNYT